MEAIRMAALGIELPGLIIFSPFLGRLRGSLLRGIFLSRPVGDDTLIITTTATMVAARLPVFLIGIFVLRLVQDGGGVTVQPTFSKYRVITVLSSW
jgi:hypothetical protein